MSKKLSKDQYKEMVSALRRVYQAIMPDLEASYKAMGETPNDEEIFDAVVESLDILGPLRTKTGISKETIYDFIYEASDMELQQLRSEVI